MPQVFGADQLGLMAEASLWVEAEYLDDVEAHENALRGAGFNQGELPTYIDKSQFHPRGDVWGQHLTSPGQHHVWAVARVQNPEVNPNARQTDVGGETPRYKVEIHRVPRNPNGRAKNEVIPVWEGNDIRHFLSGQGARPGQMTWPHVQRAMGSGPRK